MYPYIHTYTYSSETTKIQRESISTTRMQKEHDCPNFFNLYFHNNRGKDHVILDIFMEIPHIIWITLTKK